MRYVPKFKNSGKIDNTRVPIKEKVQPIPLTQEQQQNFKLYGSLNKPEVKQTYLNQGKKLTPAEQQASNKKLAEQGKLQAYQKQQEIDAKNLEKAAAVAPYVIPGIGQAMWAGKAVDLATSGVSDGTYKSWGDMVDQKTGSGEFIGDLTNPGYYGGAFPKLLSKGVQSTGKFALQKAEPYLMGDKKIPMMGYKPKSNFVDDIIYDTDDYLVNSQKKLWKKHGFETNLSKEEIKDMIYSRKNEIRRTGEDKYIVDSPSFYNEGGTSNLYEKFKGKTYHLGELHYEPSSDSKYFSIETIDNLKNKNVPKYSVSSPLYESVLNKAKENNMTGFISGEMYMSPEKTVPVIKNNFNYEISDKVKGTWGNSSGNPVFKVHSIKNTTNIPTKSILSYSPKTLLDWDNPNIYKGLIPAAGLYGLTQSKKQGGGLSRKEDYKSKDKPYPSVDKKDFAGGDRSYPIPTKADAVDALRLAGLHSRSDVKAKVYKKYPELKKHQEGGLLYPKVNQLINRTNQKNIDFVNRLKDPNRESIQNWTNPKEIATHKMSWATDDKGAVIYPNVQNIKGKLIDFTRPPYDKWAGYNSAIQRGDTIQTTPEIAQEYTTNYKKFYPTFKFKNSNEN